MMPQKTLMIAIFSGCVFALCGAELYEAAFKAGQEAEKRNNFPLAIEAYQEAAGLTGTNTRLKAGFLCRLAECYRKNKQWDKAIPVYRQVLEISDAAVEEKGLSYLQIGNRLLAQSKYPEAMQEFEKIVLMPKGVLWQKNQAQLSIGNCLRLQKKYSEAVAAYQKVLTVPNLQSSIKHEAYRLIGLCLFSDKKYSEAEAAYQKALDCKGIQNWQKVNCQTMLQKISKLK